GPGRAEPLYRTLGIPGGPVGSGHFIVGRDNASTMEGCIMILPLKFLAAAGLTASLATGGAVATHAASSENHPVAAAAQADNPGELLTTLRTGEPAHDAGRIGDDNRNDDRNDDRDHEADDADDAVTTTSTQPAPAPAPAVTVQTAGEAGTVTLSSSGGVLSVTSTQPNAGWTAEVERAQGREVEVSFRNGLRRIDFKAELEDGRLQTRVVDPTAEVRNDDPARADEPGETEVGDDHGDDQADDHVTTTTTTSDDHRGDDLRGGDDHSGPGGGDDDHSGSGHSGSGH
ncbi:MAG: hypothetical protein LC792_05860, partial [Actinobacteria bacterium]|nr:hypothetical protein [Actinomycetota bacterium]